MHFSLLLSLLYILPCSASPLPHAVTSFYLQRIREAGEMLPPLRAGTSRRVTDADVRRRQMQRRLMATLSLEQASEQASASDWRGGHRARFPPPSSTLTKKAVSLLQKSSGRLLSASVYRGVCSVCVGGAGGEGGDAQRLGCAQPSITEADYFLLSIKDRLISGSPLKGIIQLM